MEEKEEIDCCIVFTKQGKAVPATTDAKGILIHYGYYPGGSFILQDGNKKYVKGIIDDSEYIYPVRFEDEREWIDFNNAHPEIDTFGNIRSVAREVGAINRKWKNYFLDAWDFFITHDIKYGLREFSVTDFIKEELGVLKALKEVNK